MRFYVDWARTRDWAFSIDDGEAKYISLDDFLATLKQGDEVFIEAGAPMQPLRQIIEKGAKLFRVAGKDVKERRELKKDKKSDLNDVVALRDLISSGKAIYTELTFADWEDMNLKALYHSYEKATKYAASQKNELAAHQFNYGEGVYPDQEALICEKIKDGEDDKDKILDYIEKEKASEIAKLTKIKGIGRRYAIGLILLKHPKHFKSRGAYLRYCNLKHNEDEKYNHALSGLYFQIATSVLRAKNERYREVYDKSKEALRVKNEGARPYIIDGQAKKRVSTFIGKDVYDILTDKSQMTIGDTAHDARRRLGII